jgi:tRNA-2-methylthio-N6-dimethylallyladenosine synthase
MVLDATRPGQRIGKSPWLQSVVVDTAAAAGEMLTVDIVAAGPNSLNGAIAQDVAA